MPFRACLNYRTAIFIFALFVLCLKVSAAPAPEEAQKWEQLMADIPKVIKLSKNLPDAVQMCDEAIDLSRQFGPNDTRLSKSQVMRAEIYLWEKNYDLAEQTFKLAVSSCEKAVGSNDVAMIEPLSSLASFYLQFNPKYDHFRYDQVAPLYQRILKIVENAPNKNNRDIIMWSRNLGAIYQKLGRYSECEPLYKQAVALAEKDDPNWLPYELLNAADFYRAWGKYDKAEALAERSLAIREKAIKPDSGADAQMDMANCLNDLGAIYLAWSKPDKAEAVYRRSLKIVQSFTADDQADLIPHINGLATALRAQGKFEEAEPLYKQALALTEKNQGSDSLEVAASLEQYAALLNDLKKSAEAKAFLERAEKIRKQSVAKSD